MSTIKANSSCWLSATADLANNRHSGKVAVVPCPSPSPIVSNSQSHRRFTSIGHRYLFRGNPTGDPDQICGGGGDGNDGGIRGPACTAPQTHHPPSSFPLKLTC